MNLSEKQGGSAPTWGRALAERYRSALRSKHFWSAALFSIVLLTLSVIANTYGGIYATEKASNPLTDIILSNTPVFDIDGLFVYGALTLIAFVVIFLLLYPRYLPFTLDSFSIFYFVRSISVTLTHIGPFPTEAALDFKNKIILTMFGGSDMFFSGHTGAPFLLALIFWHHKRLRYIFLAWSVFFAVVVLLAHFHYTIDVFAAFFITYAIYHIALWAFPNERALFFESEKTG